MKRKDQPRPSVELDEVGQTVTITIPIKLHRRPGRKMIVVPDGAPPWAPSRAKVDDTLVRALARAQRWKRMLEGGMYSSSHEVAAAEGITHSFVCRLLRLTLLAPDIVEAILDGTLRRGLLLADLVRPLPIDWVEQRKLLA